MVVGRVISRQDYQFYEAQRVAIEAELSAPPEEAIVGAAALRRYEEQVADLHAVSEA
nr:hypothetical protein [Mesorhizobium sp. 1M-11]